MAAGDLRDMERPLLQGEEQEPGGPAATPEPSVAVEQKLPYSSGRYTFLVVHYVPFFAQLWLMRTAFLDNDRLILGCTIAALVFSGLFYSYVSWHTTAQGLFGRGFLPLRNQPLLLAIFCVVPYGFLQWVIANVHIGSTTQEREEAKFLNYKAINAIVESILTSAAILYTHWTVGLQFRFPNFHDQGVSLILAEIAIVASGGLGLLQMDSCCSRNVRERMKEPLYMWLHGFFRTCEVISRLSILAGFAVMATAHSPCWWLLIIIELGISSFLVLAHGGLRNTGVAIAICVVSATIVNVFCFVDSPSRFESAHNISMGLTLKHAAETVLAVFFLIFVMDWRLDFSLHGVSLGTAAGATVAYWLLWWRLVCLCWGSEPSASDNIFSACRRGDLQRVQQLTKQGEVQFDLDELDVSGLTPLMHAAMRGYAGICRELLSPPHSASLQQQAVGEEGCCPWRWFWEPEGRKWSALHFAAWRGHLDVLRELLRRVGELEVEPHQLLDIDGNTPLHVAGIFGHAEAFELIERMGPEHWGLLTNSDSQQPRHPSGRQGFGLEPESSDLEPEPADEPDEPPAEEDAVPVTSSSTPSHEVPLGLSSFMVCASSAQVGRIFVPRRLVSADTVRAAVYEERQQLEGAHAAGGLRFHDLRPCLADRTVVDRDRLDPITWRAPGVFIGKGAFGHVGRACDQAGNLYAVKCMRKDQRMLHCAAMREAQVALSVRDCPHPCLVKVFLYHELQEHICVVTRFCNGGTLHRAVLSRAQGLQRTGNGCCTYYRPPSEALTWLAEVFLGMEYAHRRMRGIVRDLKPGNVGLMVSGAAGGNGQAPRRRAMLLDYGSYRMTGPSVGHHSFGGDFQPCSPGYASPELLHSWPYDNRTDFYSFGVIIWVVLTGGIGDYAEPPYEQRFAKPSDLWDDWKKLWKLVERPDTWDYRLPDLPPGARELILGLVKHAPHRRLGHEEVRAALGQILRRKLPEYEASLQELEDWIGAA